MPSPTAVRHPHAAVADAAPGLGLDRKKVIAVIGANAPGLGLLSAISADPRREFAACAILDEGAMRKGEGRSFAELGAALQKGHARDEASLRAAFAGAYGAFYIQLSSDHASVENRRAAAQAVAGAAKAAGLRHLIWATLEDPGQALLEHDDLTPTFVEGRWISDEKAEEGVQEIFARFGVPVTFLETSWDPSVAAGSWTEDIGRYAYTLLRNVESIGKTVAISAARLIRGIPEGLPVEAARAVPVAVPEGPSASVRVSPSRSPAPRPGRSAAMTGAGIGLAQRWRTIGIAGAILAGGLVGLLIARQIGRKVWDPIPVASDRTPAAESPPVAHATTASQPPSPAVPVAPPAPSEEPPAPVVAEPTPGAAAAQAETASAPVDSTPSNHGAARRQAMLKLHPAFAHRPTAAPSALPAAASTTAVAAASLSPSEKTAAPVAASPAEAPHPTTAHPVPVARPAAAAAVVASPQPPAAAAPAAPAAPTARPGYVDPRAVSAAVRAHAAEARSCYDRAIMEHPDLHGRLTIRAAIDPSGRVLTLTPSSDIAEGGRLQNCLVAAFKSWPFPPPAGGVNGNISYAFSFDSEIAH